MQEPFRPAYRIAAPLRNLAQRFAYMGLVLAAFGLMLLGRADTVMMERLQTHVTDALAPIMDVLSRPVATIANVVDYGRNLTNLHEENAELRETNDRLLQWQAAARRLELENAHLRSLLNFKPDPNAHYVSARVIADTGGAFAHSLVLNAGTRDGIRKGQAAVTGTGLIGRVASAGNISARVLLITDLNSRIPVLVESTGTRAIMAGDNSDQPRLIHLPPGSTVNPGDRVVTSGHGGAFPPGLPIGVVAMVGDDRIAVQPFVGRDQLDYVRVMDFGLDGILQPPRETPPMPVSRGAGTNAGGEVASSRP